MGRIIDRRRVMGSKLPYDAEIEYLESSGTQYIDTSLTYFADFEVGIKLRKNAANKVLGNGINYCLQRQGQGYPFWQFATGQNSTQRYNTNIPVTEYHIMKWKENKIYTDGTFLANFTKDLNKPNRMYLFGGGDGIIFSNMIYFCKLWEPNSVLLVRDFIPVRVGNVGYMYDRVSKQLFGNSGRGAFILGPDK